MSGRKRWVWARTVQVVALTMVVASAIVLAIQGCSSRDRSERTAPADTEDGGSDAESEADAGDEASSMGDAGSPLLECPIERGLERFVSPSCPGLGAFGTACAQIGERCISYQQDDAWYVCSAECDATRKWRVDCASECDRTCAKPPPNAFIAELDTSDCARRPLTACNNGGITLQNQLDSQLAALLPAETFLLTDIADDVLVVQFENGCAKRYFSKVRGDALPVVEGFAGQQLASLRLRCALALRCAEFQGPAASDIP